MPTLNAFRGLASAAATAVFAAALLVAPPAAQSQAPAARPAAAKPAAPPAARPAARPPARPVARPPADAPLPPASGEQIAAAALTHFGPYDCDFGQKINIGLSTRHEGYVEVQFGRQTWVMKPILSSTGALRLEDVRGRTLMLQIANKSMLMDVAAGRRLVDECVHANQRAAMASAAPPVAAGLLAGVTGTVGGTAPALAAAVAPALAPANTDLRLRILETTDIHVHLLNYDYYQDKATDEYGLVKTATLIRRARAENRNTLLFDNGDLLQGSPLGDWVARTQPASPAQMHPAHRLMRALGFDAATLGNHEFNFGLPFLSRALETAGIPYVNANVVIDDGSGRPESMQQAYTPYVVLNRTFYDNSGQPVPLKVGVIGFVTPQIMQWDRRHLQGKVQALDIVESARKFIPRMKTEGADLIVVLAHSGFERGETARLAENAVARLAEVADVDAILFGHSHGQFPGQFFSNHPKVDLARGTINGVPAVMAGRWGDHLGVIDLVLRQEGGRWKVAESRAELRPVYDRQTRQPLVEADPELLRLIQPEHEATLAFMRSQVATTSAPLQSYFAQVADDASVQIVSQAQLAYAQRALAGTPHADLPLLSAAAPFKSGGRQGWTNYTDIPAGPLAVRNVADLYVFPNTVKVVKLSGAQVREWLEFSAGAFNRIDPRGPAEQDLLNTSFPSFNFDTLDGVRYSIDLTQPARYDRSGKLVAPQARRIRDLQFNGRPVSDRDSFAVVTNSYRASGGGNFPGLDGSNIILDAPDENREVLLQHLQGLGTVEPAADQNWRLLPVRGVKLRFVSSAAGRAHLAQSPQVRWVRDNGDGSALYEVVPAAGR